MSVRPKLRPMAIIIAILFRMSVYYYIYYPKLFLPNNINRCFTIFLYPRTKLLAKFNLPFKNYSSFRELGNSAPNNLAIDFYLS